MDSNTKSDAYAVWAEWGPALRISREERMAECFPEVSEADRLAFLSEFEIVRAEIWKVAEEGAEKRHTKEAFEKRMTDRFPWMKREALDKAWFLANYYAWHEGYDKR